MKKLLLLTIMIIALSLQAKADNLSKKCNPVGGGVFRCDYGDIVCMRDRTNGGLQCFKK